MEGLITGLDGPSSGELLTFPFLLRTTRCTVRDALLGDLIAAFRQVLPIPRDTPD